MLNNSPVGSIYDKTKDRESAFEVLKERAKEAQRREEKRQQEEEDEREQYGRAQKNRTGYQSPQTDRDDRPNKRSRTKRTTTTRKRQTVTEAATKTLVSTVAVSLGKALVRGILGSLKKGF